MQIATVPARAKDGDGDVNFGRSLVGPDKRIRRADFERLVLDLAVFIEQLGFADGPRWPTITMTPLAVYRDVPAATRKAGALKGLRHPGLLAAS